MGLFPVGDLGQRFSTLVLCGDKDGGHSRIPLPPGSGGRFHPPFFLQKKNFSDGERIKHRTHTKWAVLMSLSLSRSRSFFGPLAVTESRASKSGGVDTEFKGKGLHHKTRVIGEGGPHALVIVTLGLLFGIFKEALPVFTDGLVVGRRKEGKGSVLQEFGQLFLLVFVSEAKISSIPKNLVLFFKNGFEGLSGTVNQGQKLFP